MLWIYEWQQSDNVANMDSKGGNYSLGSRPFFQMIPERGD